MKALVPALILLVGLLCLSSCSDDESPAAPPPTPVELGPFVLNFENRPDDGFVGKDPPITLGDGVTVTDVLPSGAKFYDFTSSDGWGLAGCNAEAFSGEFLIGHFNNGDTVTMVITFDSPVSQVGMYASDADGFQLILRTYDDAGAAVGADTLLGACPSLAGDDTLRVDAGSNRIKTVHIWGEEAPVLDDLSYYRFH